MEKANIVIAGDAVYAGIAEDDITEIPLALVIQFKSLDELRQAMQDRSVELTVFDKG